ncbi:MAG: spermidine/putrescine ABC transporter substrate-binding protein, partial [Actinomycetota bacterium]|nr:spermidine/putrescine ABC transporter substrate-binding protein [Actinomycetota bacterium]
MHDMDRFWAASPLTRRELLRRAGRGSMYLGVMGLLSACGVRAQRTEGPGDRPSPSPLGSPSGQLDIANWPLYIDQDDDGNKPTVNDFQEETGISVTYRESIEDNESFFGTIREPLAAGQSTGWDIIVVTDWLIAKMVRLGYLEELHHDRLPTFFENAGQIYQSRSYDPGNRFSIPWQSGITGIGYN